jgi:hypothetical protein
MPQPRRLRTKTFTYNSLSGSFRKENITDIAATNAKRSLGNDEWENGCKQEITRVQRRTFETVTLDDDDDVIVTDCATDAAKGSSDHLLESDEDCDLVPGSMQDVLLHPRRAKQKAPSDESSPFSGGDPAQPSIKQEMDQHLVELQTKQKQIQLELDRIGLEKRQVDLNLEGIRLIKRAQDNGGEADADTEAMTESELKRLLALQQEEKKLRLEMRLVDVDMTQITLNKERIRIYEEARE